MRCKDCTHFEFTQAIAIPTLKFDGPIQPGTYHFEKSIIDEGNTVCLITRNEIVDRFGTEINTTPCEYYEQDYAESFVNYIDIQPLPF